MNDMRLGRSGLEVSPICLGAMMFGDASDAATSASIVDSARGQRGILSGKYTSVYPLPEGSRAARQDRRMLQAELRPESIALARKMHARAYGSTASRFALQWVLNNALVSSVIAGPRTFERWEDYLAALEAPFGADDEALVVSRVPAGHSSTPGCTDPQYPVTGRVARTAASLRKSKT